MALDIFVNVGSGSNENTLIPPQAFGGWNGGDYAIFNMDSGHMLVSMTLQKRGFAAVKVFAEQLADQRYKGRDEAAYVMNWLFRYKSAQEVHDAMSSTEKFECRLEIQALRSALHLGPLTYHKVVSDPEERRKWAAYELSRPNFEIALAEEVLLPLRTCCAVIAISPFGYYPINKSTVELLRPGGFLVVAGSSANKFCKKPADEATPEDFGLQVVPPKDGPAWFSALMKRQCSVHTHSTDRVELDYQLYQLA